MVLKKKKTTKDCPECDEECVLADLVLGVTPANEVEHEFIRMFDWHIASGDPLKLKLARNTLLQAVNVRLGQKEPPPRLWLPVAESSSRGGFTLQPLCEHCGGWHAVGASLDAPVDTISEYIDCSFGVIR